MVAPLALWVTPVAEIGGVARHVLDVARVGLPGYRLAVLCPEGHLAEDLRSIGAAVLTGPFGPGAGSNPLAAAAASAVTLRRALRTLRPHVVHSHLAYADMIAAAVVRGLSVPGVPRRATGGTAPLLVSTEHGIAGDAALYHSSAARARATAALHRARLRVTDVRIAVAEATARAMAERWAAEDVVVIRNGIDRDRIVERDEGPSAAPRILSLARLTHEKGLHELLNAFASFRRHYPFATLTLAGEGPERGKLVAAVHDLDLGESVDFPGHLPADRAMATHDVVVQLSRWENCSYTLLDAVAAGLGVVATDVGGNREILPKKCLVDDAHYRPPRMVHQVIANQLDSANRPSLPILWPTIQEMGSEIVNAYIKNQRT